jgi:hypothetical protein
MKENNGWLRVVVPVNGIWDDYGTKSGLCCTAPLWHSCNMLHTPDDVIEALRARKADVGLSDEALEEIVGLCRGHIGKIIGPTRERGASLFTLMMIVGALGCGLALVPDPQAAIRRRWERRLDSRVRDNGRIGKEAIRKARPLVLAELARRGGLARWAGATDRERRQVGRMLAEARHRAHVPAHAGL